MKTTLCLWLCAGVTSLLPNARALPPDSGGTGPAQEPVRIIQRVRPAFPARLARRGVHSGEVRLILHVDASGALLDSLVVASTHPELADTIDLVLPQWRFLPATVNGEPYAAMIDVAAGFTARGMTLAVRDVDAAPAWNSADYDRAVREEYELDAPLKPTREPTPVNPALAGEEPVTGSARVAFFVDRSGRVRLARVVAADNERLGRAALAAVQQMWFQSPAWRRRPTLAHATRTFAFGPGN